jgi:hypothetical protein
LKLTDDAYKEVLMSVSRNTGCLVLVAIFVGLIVTPILLAVAKDSARMSRIEKAMKGNADARVTASALVRATRSNEAEAIRLYDDKVIDVTGVIRRVKVSRKSGIVNLGDGAGSTIQCEFRGEMLNRISLLRPGGIVTFRGVANIDRVLTTVYWCEIR